MSWHRYAPSLALAALILLTVALGPLGGWLWLALTGAALPLQVTALWRRYRNE